MSNRSAMSNPSVRQGLQRGFTMIELMVALLIGLFIAGGLMILVQDNKRTFTAQGALAQLQDSERLAGSLMTDIIQTAGYFPSPTLYTAAAVLPTSNPTWALGQYISGTNPGTAQGDTVSVRFATNSGDGILNCAGTSNSSGAVYTYINTFSVNTSNQLVCTRGDLAGPNNVYPLINGVQKLTILFGVNSAGTTNNVDSYMTATQVTAQGRWPNVMSVQVHIIFTNPLYTAGGNGGQPATITFQRNIGVMGVVGI